MATITADANWKTTSNQLDRERGLQLRHDFDRDNRTMPTRMVVRQQGPAQDAPRPVEGVGRDRDGVGRDEQDREEGRHHPTASILMTYLFVLGRPHFFFAIRCCGARMYISSKLIFVCGRMWLSPG